MIFGLNRGITKFQLILVLLCGLLAQAPPPAEPNIQVEVNGVAFNAE